MISISTEREVPRRPRAQVSVLGGENAKRRDIRIERDAGGNRAGYRAECETKLLVE